MKQQSFSSFEQSQRKKRTKRTKRDIFLNEMDQFVPWVRLETLIAPHYTKP